ncbi:MAG: pilus assembly protein PilM [Planctomycetota bacterium]|jgi:type IV pilus assembly protein PilM
MGRSVGLEIHTRGVRAIELVGSGKKIRVRRYVEKRVAPRGGLPDPEELREALEEIFKAGRFPKNSVVGCVESRDTVTREIPVPFKSDDQIKKVIKYEVEHHLHDCDADDVIVQYIKVGDAGDGTNLLVFASKKNDISRGIEAARTAGVELLAMDLDALAVVHAVEYAGLFEESPNSIVIRIGHRSTEILFVRDGMLRAVRSVRMGMDSIAHGLARDMDIEFSEADAKLSDISHGKSTGDLIIPSDGGLDIKADTEKSHAELEQDLFRQKRDEFVARLKREFVRSSAALGGGGAERIFVTGPGLRVPDLLDLLAARMGKPLEVFHPKEHFEGNTGSNGKDDDDSVADFDACSAVALGLALKGLGQDPLGVDFRQEELKVANKFELLKNALAVAVTLVFLALMGASFFFVYKKTTLRRDVYAHIQTDAYKEFNMVCDAYSKLGDALVPERMKVKAKDIEDQIPRYETLERYNRQLRRMRKQLESKVGGEGLDPIISSLTRWNAVMGAVSKLHKEIEYIDFDGLEITQKTARITIVVKDASSAKAVEKAISALPAMKGLEPEGGWQWRPMQDSQYGKVTISWRLQKSRKGRRS